MSRFLQLSLLVTRDVSLDRQGVCPYTLTMRGIRLSSAGLRAITTTSYLCALRLRLSLRRNPVKTRICQTTTVNALKAGHAAYAVATAEARNGLVGRRPVREVVLPCVSQETRRKACGL
jgi:hypothetical protein